MALNSYFDFAENDFQYFKASYDAGIVANMMGAMAQGICEKYMKHLISEYYKPDDAIQQKDFENILRTHSLNRLMKFLKANMGAEFSKNTQTHMRMIDGFYFSTRYPGDDSIEIDGDDVETCNDAIELCRKEVLAGMLSLYFLLIFNVFGLNHNLFFVPAAKECQYILLFGYTFQYISITESSRKPFGLF